jgi:hypothetical protein
MSSWRDQRFTNEELLNISPSGGMPRSMSDAICQHFLTFAISLAFTGRCNICFVLFAIISEASDKSVG